MKSNKDYDAIICVAQKDTENISEIIERIINNFGCKKVKILSNAMPQNVTAEFEYLNENEVLEGLSFSAIVDYFNSRNVKPSRVGWYLQQFLKMAYCYKSEYDNYLLWDADTFMLKPIKFFDEEGRIYLDNSRIFEDKIFNNTVLKVLGYPKERKETYITEHMMIDKGCMEKLLETIAKKYNCDTKDFWRKILDCLNDEELTYGGFSEFELIGTFMEHEFPEKINFRPLKSKRNIANSVGCNINQYDMRFFTKKYDFVTFEKTHKVQTTKIKHLFNKIRFFIMSTFKAI